jgi:uncharacterized protein YegJ (DUF2314 family)
MSAKSMMDTWQVDGADPEMTAAIQAARETIGNFFAAFEAPEPGQTAFLLKIRYIKGDRSEHIWLADLDFTTMPATGTVANETTFPDLKYMQRASFEPDQITDWMYFDSDKLVGSYTTQLLLRRSKPQ